MVDNAPQLDVFKEDEPVTEAILLFRSLNNDEFITISLNEKEE